MKTTAIQTAILLAVVVLASNLHAQYTLDWSIIGASGGALNGGGYTLDGTVGQPVAGNLNSTGGSYELSSGFWSIIQNPSAPFLSLTRNNGDIVISWPQSAAGYTLQQAPTVSALPGSWTTISPPYDTNATSFYFRLTLPLTSSQKFFRLLKP